MSVELKVFGGAYFPKDKALKKHPDLKPLATAVNAATKAIAEAVIFGKLAAEHPEHIDDYFKVKIWEHCEGLPCPELDVFSSDFFGEHIVWNTNQGEPAAAQKPETDNNETGRAAAVKIVRNLDQDSRAACLALFGAVEEITDSQYGQVVDLNNDDDGCFQRELAQAFVKEPRVFALSGERQEELLAWVRKTMKVSTQWPDIKKGITKWIDTPAAKREPVAADIKPDTEASLGGNNPTDRSSDLVHNLATLRLETALGILSAAMDFDIYAIPSEIVRRAKEMESEGRDPRFSAWWNKLRGTPGILDFSRAAIIALIKTAPEDLYLRPVDLRAYINRNLVESNHAKPDQKTIDIACGNMKRETNDDETKPSVSGETQPPAVCPAKAAQLDKELNKAFAQSSAPVQEPTDQPKVENLGGGVFSVDALINTTPSNEVEKQEVPPALSVREIEITHALNELMSGRTNIGDQDDIENLITTTGKDIKHIFSLLIADITTTEFCLSPDFSDEEVQDVATTILEQWSDDISVRQKIALDAIVEYRRPAPPKSVALDPPAVTAKPDAEPEPVAETNAPLSSITYQQQLTIAALQGLCSNPAYCNQYEELPAMAAGLARSVINHQEGSCASD
ncbi:exodeoxyribonuclease VIII [Enterobacter bugandensis]|uniref:exodeoxyribonuclease VIII n=1 Tax=Enterobacter bugandensis TaxID=881260 RepID=UPI002005B595|nr:exodeoxyribonuclease VIII [Enterobacter bugandensis]MCK7159883.1 exodeoxyribonuclease VIII [Enterobacter bugandensis]